MTPEQKKQIVKMYSPGVTLKTIAEKYDLSRERVRQIMKDEGGPKRSRVDTIRARHLALLPRLVRDFEQMGLSKAAKLHKIYHVTARKMILKEFGCKTVFEYKDQNLDLVRLERDYEKMGLNALARKWQVSAPRLVRVLRNHGVRIRKSGEKVRRVRR